MPAADDLCLDAYEAAHSNSKMRRIKGWLKNKLGGALNMRQGFGTSNKDIAKNMASAGLQNGFKEGGVAVLKQGLKLIPFVGSLTSTIVDKAKKKVEDKLLQKRAMGLRAKFGQGQANVGEMNEMMQLGGKAGNEIKLLEEAVEKTKDAIRKMTDAHNDCVQKITRANNCKAYYEAAKAFYYYSHRLDRLRTYLTVIRTWGDEVSDMIERYEATVIGYEADLMESLQSYFRPTNESYHLKNCKPEDCYFGQ